MILELLHDRDVDEISHVATVFIVGALVITGTASIIYKYMQNPVDTFTQNGKTHHVIKSSWLYYWLYRVVECLSFNFKTITRIGLQNDNKIGVALTGFIKLCSFGVFGKKLQKYAKETYEVEKAIKPELQKDIPEVEKVLDDIQKDLPPPPTTTISIKGKATATTTPHAQIPYQLSPTKVEVKAHSPIQQPKNNDKKEIDN